MRHGDVPAGDEIHQVGAVPVPARARQHHAGAGEERSEDLPQGKVEAEGGALQHPVARAERIFLLGPEQTVDQARVRGHDTLGAARRPGGVEDAGQALRISRAAGNFLRRRGRLQVVEAEHTARPDGLQVSGERGARQDDRRAAVGEEPGEPFPRQLGIEGHVGAAGLQHGEQGGHHRAGPVDTDADRHVRSDPQGAEAAGQPASPVRQLAVAQALSVALHRHGVRRPRGLGREQLVQAEPGPRNAGVVPFPEHLRALGRGDER